MDLDEFNRMTRQQALTLADAWAAVPAWTHAIVAGRPYTSVAAVLDLASTLAAAWTDAEVDAALAAHPRIGERPTGAGRSAAQSRHEQAGSATTDEEVATAIAAGNAAYEARFGRVFLIRAAGRSAEEILAELRRRLRHDAGTERVETARQLAEIALLRIEREFA